MAAVLTNSLSTNPILGPQTPLGPTLAELLQSLALEPLTSVIGNNINNLPSLHAPLHLSPERL